MANRNTLTGGTDWSEEGLKPTDLNDTFDATVPQFYADNTGGSHSADTTETDVATITITQNDLNDNSTIVINSGVHATSQEEAQRNVTFRLYINGSVVKSVTFKLTQENGTSNQFGQGTNFCHIATALDTTAANIIVKVTAQLDNTGTDLVASCMGLTVVGYRA